MLFMVESLGFSVLFFIGHIGVRRQNGQIVVFIRVKRRNSLSHRRGFIGKKRGREKEQGIDGDRRKKKQSTAKNIREEQQRIEDDVSPFFCLDYQ